MPVCLLIVYRLIYFFLIHMSVDFLFSYHMYLADIHLRLELLLPEYFPRFMFNAVGFFIRKALRTKIQMSLSGPSTNFAFCLFCLYWIIGSCSISEVKEHEKHCKFSAHYENMPIWIFWKFYHQKMKISDKKIWYFSHVCSKHRLWVLVRTASSRRF